MTERISVSDVITLAERSTPEHLFSAFQTSLGQLINSHYEKEPIDLFSTLDLLYRALIDGPTWKNTASK